MSLNCPACERPAQCKDSRRRKNNMVKRRYDCPHCGLRFQTLEVVVAVLEQVKHGKLMYNKEDSTKSMKLAKEILESTHIPVI